jgi:hypothetical protein
MEFKYKFKCVISDVTLSNYKLFSIKDKKFVKFESETQFRLILDRIVPHGSFSGYINGVKYSKVKEILIQQEVPVTLNIDNTSVKVSSDNGFEILIGEKSYHFNNSGTVKYIHVLDYPLQQQDICIQFKRDTKVFTINTNIQLPFYLGLPMRMAQNDNEFNQILKDVESYTGDEIRGVIESLFN